MLKLLTLIVTLLNASAVQAENPTNPALIAKTMEAATFCVLAAGKSGADRGRFSAGTEWIANADKTGFRHAGMPITVTFPADRDGIARICVVQATLASQDDQSQVQRAFEVVLKKKPFQQSDSVIWMLNTKTGSRGLQLFPDKISEQPKIRLIGAAF